MKSVSGAALAKHGDARQQTMRKIIPGTVMVGLSMQLAFSVLIVTGAALALTGSIEVGALIGALVLTARFTGPVADVGELLGAVRTAHNDLVQISDLLDEAPLDEPATDVATPSDSSVVFDNVSFAYPSGPPVLDSVSLRAEAGRMIALVGASGAGKPTLVSLMPRFADAIGGSLRVGGVDVRDLTSDTLIGMVAMVLVR
jgi:ATP-binding cassette subfamily B protein